MAMLKIETDTDKSLKGGICENIYVLNGIYNMILKLKKGMDIYQRRHLSDEKKVPFIGHFMFGGLFFSSNWNRLVLH